MMNQFQKHKGYSQTFREGKLTLGLMFPLEAYESNIPVMNMAEQIKLAKTADTSHFAALFVRDVPLNKPSFGDVGQMYDPWIFLSYIAAHTKNIALGTSSVITSFQHPLNLAKSAASMDNISGERLILGLATGDRPIEFAAFRLNREKRGDYYREAFYVMKETWKTSFPMIHSTNVNLTGETDLLPKPVLGDIPIFTTGFSGQSLQWIAKHSDGWLSYPRHLVIQERFINEFRSFTKGFKPFAQSLAVDLSEDSNDKAASPYLIFKGGYKHLIEILYELQKIGVNHIIINLKDSKRPANEVIQELCEEVAPHFPALN